MHLTWSRSGPDLVAKDETHELVVAPARADRAQGWRLFRRRLGSAGPLVAGDRVYRTPELAQDAGERDPRWPAPVADDGPEAA